MSLTEVCWNISSVFIVIVLGVMAILCVLMLLGVFVCIFDHDDNHKNDKNSKGITMATNVTEKDKTLNEIIDWAKSRCHEAGLSRFDVRRKSDRDFYDGQVNAFHEMLELCRSMLGYSGSMPSEVPNQSEDANVRAVNR